MRVNWDSLAASTSLALVCSLLAPNGVTAAPSEACRDKVRALVAVTLTTADEDARIGHSLDLASYVHDHIECASNRKAIDDIIHLLSERDEGLRISAAMALSYIGPPARRAVPELRRVVQESDARLDADSTNPVLPVSTSGDAARTAIRKITGEKVPDYVEGWKKTQRQIAPDTVQPK
jgi:HEAT repeat protein